MALKHATLPILLLALGCAEDPASRCRVSNAFAQAGRAMTNQTDYTANALENMRCDFLDAEQRAEAREQAREAREQRRERDREDAEQARASWLIAQKLKALRADPKAPELDNTKREAQSICTLTTERRGEWVDQGDKIGCKIGGVPTFACIVGDDGEMTECTTYREGAELGEVRDEFVGDYGQPSTTQVSARGFHVYSWTTQNQEITVTGYDGGVSITRARVDADSDSE